jgi:hypothetical protein
VDQDPEEVVLGDLVEVEVAMMATTAANRVRESCGKAGMIE